MWTAAEWVAAQQESGHPAPDIAEVLRRRCRVHEAVEMADVGAQYARVFGPSAGSALLERGAAYRMTQAGQGRPA